MLNLVVTEPHRYTHELLRRRDPAKLKVRSYDWLSRERTLPRGAYIFGDLDRLSYWELELATHAYLELKKAGLTVINHPGRVKQREALLRGLFRNGLNSYNVYRVDDEAIPRKFPVFLRTISAHRGPLTDLIANQRGLQQAIEDALAAGYPRRELLVVEYCAEPRASGVFRKLSIHRVGNRFVPAICVHDTHWISKNGQFGVASSEDYRDELDLIQSHRYEAAIRPAFEFAEIEYGRADFAIVNGRVEVYEINTNPFIAQFYKHPNPLRVKSSQLEIEGLRAALIALTPERSLDRVVLKSPRLDAQRRSDRRFGVERWRI